MLLLGFNSYTSKINAGGELRDLGAFSPHTRCLKRFGSAVRLGEELYVANT
jgi:hypothetical protein